MKYLALALVLAGCTSMSIRDYDKGEISQDQADRDVVECEQKGKEVRANAGGGLMDAIALDASYNKGFDACMEAKGYQRR